MQKIREIQYAVFKTNAENLRFWAFLTILAQMADFGQTRPKMSNFRVFLKKRHFFTLPKASIHVKN